MSDSAFHIDEKCSTAEEFIRFLSVESRQFSTQHIYDAITWGVNGYIFRGQSDQIWKLIPTAFRGSNPLAKFTPQTAGGELADDASVLQHLGWQLQAELRAVFLFLETADRIGIETPIDYSNIGQHRGIVQAALKEQEEANYAGPFPASDLLNAIALAQHHGVPTRLLDWTESPLVAAFFAALGVSSVVSKPLRPSSGRIVVIFLKMPRRIDKEFAVGIVNSPRYSNSFLRAQKGLFTSGRAHLNIPFFG